MNSTIRNPTRERGKLGKSASVGPSFTRFEVARFTKTAPPSYSYSMKWYSYSYSNGRNRVRVPPSAEYEYDHEKPGISYSESYKSATSKFTRRVERILSAVRLRGDRFNGIDLVSFVGHFRKERVCVEM
jgi:hypothetical protein